MTTTIYTITQANFIIKGNDIEYTTCFVVNSYTRKDLAQVKMQFLADRFEREHYMNTFEREIENANVIKLVTGNYGTTFQISENTLFEEH